MFMKPPSRLPGREKSFERAAQRPWLLRWRQRQGVRRLWQVKWKGQDVESASGADQAPDEVPSLQSHRTLGSGVQK